MLIVIIYIYIMVYYINSGFHFFFEIIQNFIHFFISVSTNM